MNILSLFSRKSIPPPIPETEPQYKGIEAIKAFSTDDEPKLVDYPKGKYFAYWEILMGDVPGGYTAVVRFYGYANHQVSEEAVFTEPTIRALKPKVNQFIRTKMESFKR
jgi:hypothetical protein